MAAPSPPWDPAAARDPPPPSPPAADDGDAPAGCLPVDPLPPDYALAEELVDGTEYLRRVRHEAARLPDVLIAAEYRDLAVARMHDGEMHDGEMDDGEMEEEEMEEDEMEEWGEEVVVADAFDEPHAPPPPHACDPAWLEAFLSAFEELRVTLDGAGTTEDATMPKVPAVADRQGWRRFATRNDPTTAVLAAVQEHEAPALLECLADELAAVGDGVDERLAAWVYGTMARIGWPLDADAAASLRGILRHAANARRVHADGGTRARAHVLMAAAGVYFKQAGDDWELRIL